MKKEFEISLIQGKYKDAEILCENMEFSDVRDVIMTIAYNTESVCVYAFSQYMIYTTKRVEWIELTIDIMLHPLCFLEGAYSIALFYTRELLAIEENVENLERILFFYNMPDKLISKEEAQNIAQKILIIEPENVIALGIQ